MLQPSQTVLELICSTKLGGLESIASVDTMVTVVDAFRFFSEFDTAEFLQDRFSREEVPEEDQRTISDLFADQIEFANVIIVNKIDAVDKQTLGRVKAYAKTLNPTAKIIEAKFSKVNVKDILNTRVFNFAEAVTSPGWLRSLHEMTVISVQGRKRLAPKPETLEYNIGSFVYRARYPFDPLKLYQLIEGRFILLQEELEDDGENGNEDTGVSDDNASIADSASDNHTTSAASDSDIMTENGSDKPPLSDGKILSNKRASPLFAGLHRSKGIFWLATRPFLMGSWSTAGAMLTLGSEMPWFCCIPEEDWVADPETVAAIRKDFEGKWADRRQELVLIGEGIDVEGLTRALDACLLSKKEMRKWEKVMCDEKMNDVEKEEKLGELWDDGYWAEWAKPDEEDHEGHYHH